MAATSRHYGDVATWIGKVIDSCETPLQEVTARKLVRQFESVYADTDRKMNWALSKELRVKLDSKMYARLNKKTQEDGTIV